MDDVAVVVGGGEVELDDGGEGGSTGAMVGDVVVVGDGGEVDIVVVPAAEDFVELDDVEEWWTGRAVRRRCG